MMGVRGSVLIYYQITGYEPSKNSSETKTLQKILIYNHIEFQAYKHVACSLAVHQVVSGTTPAPLKMLGNF